MGGKTIREAIGIALEGLTGDLLEYVCFAKQRNAMRNHVKLYVHDYARNRGVILTDADIEEELNKIVDELKSGKTLGEAARPITVAGPAPQPGGELTISARGRTVSLYVAEGESIESVAERAAVVMNAAVIKDDESRCAVCAWPLVEDKKDGCVRGNCSLRPRPEKMYAPERAKTEQYALALRNGMPPSGRWA